MAPPTARLFEKCELFHKAILAIAPHPDDETLGCGGFLATAASRGAKITVLFLTSGEKGLPCKPPDQARAVREAEARAAMDALGLNGAEVHFTGFPDGDLARHETAIAGYIEGTINRLQPDLILMPHASDPHQDHQIAARCARRAAERSDSAILLYEYPAWLWFRAPFVRTRPGLIGWLHYLATGPWGLFVLWRSGLNTRVDVREALEKKQTAAVCHASQTLPGYCAGKQNLGELAEGRFLKRLVGSRHEYFRRTSVGGG